MLARIAARFAASTEVVARPGQPNELALIAADKSWSVLVLEHPREPAAVFLARICDERGADPTTVLRLAGQMGAGALALVGTHYVVRYVVPAAQIDTAPLETIVSYVRDTARALEAALLAKTEPDAALALGHLVR